MGLSNSQKGILKVAQKQCIPDEDSYRDAMENHAGVRSATKMDHHGFRAFMAYFVKLGFIWKGIMPEEFYNPGDYRNRQYGMATENQLWKIHREWWQLMRKYWGQTAEDENLAAVGKKALRGFLKNRFRVDHEKFLTFNEASKAIEGIKAIGTRG